LQEKVKQAKQMLLQQDKSTSSDAKSKIDILVTI
jgi:hypothetical protein